MKYTQTIFSLSIAFAMVFMAPSAVFAIDVQSGSGSSVGTVASPSPAVVAGSGSSVGTVASPSPAVVAGSGSSVGTVASPSPAVVAGSGSSVGTVVNPPVVSGSGSSAGSVSNNPPVVSGSGSSVGTVANPPVVSGSGSSVGTVVNPPVVSGSGSSVGTVTTPATPPTPPAGGNSGSTGGYSGSSSSGSYVGVNSSTLPLLTNIRDCNYLTVYLKIGQANPPVEVIKLQNFLKNNEKMNVAVTGTFDEATFNAVSAFQIKYSLDVLNPWGINNSTGYVYYTTTKKINELFCKKNFALTATQIREIEAYRTGIQNHSASVSGDVGTTVHPSTSTTTSVTGIANATSTNDTQVAGAAKTSFGTKIWNFIKRIFGR